MRFAWPLIVLAAVLACGDDPAPAPAPPGETSSTSSSSSSGALPSTADVNLTTETTTFAGKSRRYLLAKPTDYDATRKYPVVMALHGNPGTAEAMVAILPFHTISKRDAIVVYPNALANEWDQYTPGDANVDIPWFGALLAELGQKLNIDPKRVLGFGVSGGAFMVVQVTCRLSGVFSAIGVLSGGGPDEPDVADEPRDEEGCVICAGAPVAAIVMHGDADAVVTFDSGDATRKCYARYNGCKDTLVPAKVSPCQAYEGCAAGKPVEWCPVPGQSHDAWTPSMQASWDMFRALP